MVISHGSYNVPEVALTFDDGPGQYTPQVLARLQLYNVQATIFPIGQNIASYPNYLQQAIAAGNVVGNHSWTHPHLTTMSRSAMYTELNNTQTAVQNATGVCPTLFRPPYGEYNADLQSVAKDLGLTLITWNVHPNDWDSPPPSPDVIASRVLNSVGNGSIVLLHEGDGDRSNTVAALPAIITGLQARGLRIVTIPQLIADMN
jgi:peptidoglycan/xylan/chitin deacetylase (PgdA/CDA1 family)